MRIVLPVRKSFALALALGLTPLAAFATPPSTSPYATDTQSVWVHDATASGMSSMNLVLCVLHSMRPDAMVNQGPYIALVDMNKCDPKSEASASNSTAGASGATSAPNYMTAVVNVTRASDTAPMIGKVWMSMTQQGQQMNVYAYLSATKSPTAAPPYGDFRLDYINKMPGGTVGFNGFIQANGSNVNFLETGSNSSNTALAMTATSTTAGSGTMQTQDQSVSPPTTSTFNFAYDGSEVNFPSGVFRRDEGSADVCFDRSKANAQESVWRYGTYNDNDGTRVDQANPGFPITLTYSGSTYYGYAGYWGINFQGFNLNSVADGPLAGATVQDQRPGNTTTYTLSKVSGRLTKWTQNQKTLADMDGIPFSVWANLGGTLGSGNWQMHWDNANSQFVVTGQQTCGSNGCVVSSITPAVSLAAGTFSTQPLEGWSNGFGGNIEIPSTNASHVGTDTVYFYSQQQVIPGSASAPTALYCLNNCPTATALSSFIAGTSSSPFDATTQTQFGSGTVSVTYSFDSGGLKESSTPMVVTNASLLTGQFQNGIMTGRLYDTPLTNSNCPAGSPGTQICEPAHPTTYYTWQTGADQWNQSTWLTRTSNSTVVIFDPPENISYTVPSGSAYGSWAGKHIQLQFDGFGNLNGIPGGCVSGTNNAPVSCNTAGARYVPAFALPDGTTFTLPSSGTPIIVKSLEAEMRLRQIPNCTGVSLAQPINTVTLPTSTSLHDPTNSADSEYIGTEPTVTGAPKVIDGVVQ